MSSSRAPATAATPRGGAAGTPDDRLWAKAAELERDFARYKCRLAERRAEAAAAAEVLAAGGGAGEERRGGGDDDDVAAGRGRRYEEYVRRRDERLRNEWRARMERKEAEMQALWARLDRAGSRGRRGGGGELAAATASSSAGEDHGSLRQKPTNLEVKVRPTAPVTPRCGVPSSPATKLSRPRTSVPSSPAAGASPRLSTLDPRRRPSHLHREQPLQAAELPATPRKENRLPPPPLWTAAAAPPATPRPRTMLSRSRSLFKDRGSSAVTARESPRPPRLQPPRSSYDSASSVREPAAPSPPHADAIAMTRSNSCSNRQAVLGAHKKASAVAPEPFRLGRSGNGGVETVSPSQVIRRDETDSSEVSPAGHGNADRKSNQEHVDQSSDKVGSVEITGDSDTEPSYVYIKKDSGEQTPRPCYALADLRTCPGTEPLSDSKDSDDNVDDTMESTGSNDVAGETPVTDAEDAFRRESSESLYSNVHSSFSPRSELDTSAAGSPLPSATEQSPESYASPRPRKKPEVEDGEKSLPMPTTQRSSVTVSITVQSPMDAVTGLKRLLTFGRKNSKGSEAAAAVVERTPRSMAPDSTPSGDGCMSGEWSAGDSVKARLDSSDVASADDLDSNYVISPHVHRSFFSFTSFKSRAI